MTFRAEFQNDKMMLSIEQELISGMKFPTGSFTKNLGLPHEQNLGSPACIVDQEMHYFYKNTIYTTCVFFRTEKCSSKIGETNAVRIKREL